MMSQITRLLSLTMILAATLSGMGQSAHAQSADPDTLEALADEVVAASMARYPQWATFLGQEDARHDQLFDNSLSALDAWQAKEDGWLARLTAMQPPETVGSRDWVTYGILRQELESAAATRICRNELWHASTETSWHTNLPFVFKVQPIATKQQRQLALTRLSAVPAFIDTEIENLKRGLALGFSSPRVTVTKVPEQVRSLIKEDSIFLSPGKRSDDQDFEDAVQEIYNEDIVPALRRYATFIEGFYLQAARENLSVAGNPDGAKCYPTLIHSFSTIKLEPEIIHQLGLQQVALIREDMQNSIDKHFGGGSIENFLRRANADPEFTYSSEEEVLDYSVSALASAKSAMAEAFGRLPVADVEVQPYPDFAESGIGEYWPPSKDGSRPGTFYIAVKNPQTRSRATAISTLYHETYPGHHLQKAIAIELGEQVHDAARYFGNSGFTEGWALYAERLADELGLYNNPIDYFGMLSEQGARAARLVIDTGLHTKNWSRQKAIDYMKSNTAWSAGDIENDIDRYISNPGQATSYMLGMLEIKRLRELAEDELGKDFDRRAFHDRVVGFGGVTLPMLNTSIVQWIAQNQRMQPDPAISAAGTNHAD
ncbi:MAG: DUF885 domain-containing protein [Halieaceae bacterium]